MNQTVFFAFRDNPMCFVHVLLNSLELANKGMGGKIVLEGEAVTLVPLMAEKEHFLHPLFSQAKEKNLIVGACRACSAKLKMTEAINALNIPLIGGMSGHPAMSTYIQQGYTILTF